MLGTVGVFYETSAVKQEDKTPAVQRQYLGCIGKIDNGIVAVHVSLPAAAQALLNAEVYLPVETTLGDLSRLVFFVASLDRGHQSATITT